jgi:hypothetical protein
MYLYENTNYVFFQLADVKMRCTIKKKLASTMRRLGFTYPEAYCTVCISVVSYCLCAPHSSRLIIDTTVNWSQQLNVTAGESGESLGVGNLVAPLSDLAKPERERWGEGEGQCEREREGRAR